MTWANWCPTTTTSVWSHGERRSRRRSARDSRSSASECDSRGMCRVQYGIWDMTVDLRWPCDTRGSTEREESESLKCGAPSIFSAQMSMSPRRGGDALSCNDDLDFHRQCHSRKDVLRKRDSFGEMRNIDICEGANQCIVLISRIVTWLR